MNDGNHSIIVHQNIDCRTEDVESRPGGGLSIYRPFPTPVPLLGL